MLVSRIRPNLLFCPYPPGVWTLIEPGTLARAGDVQRDLLARDRDDDFRAFQKLSGPVEHGSRRDPRPRVLARSVGPLSARAQIIPTESGASRLPWLRSAASRRASCPGAGPEAHTPLFRDRRSAIAFEHNRLREVCEDLQAKLQL